MKKIILLLLMALFIVGTYGCQSEEMDGSLQESYIVIDINPSIEIITDDSGEVISVNPLNDDAEILLFDASFVGMSMEDTVNQILALALEMGYLEEELDNAILVTVASDANVEEVEDKIESEVEKFVSERKMKMEVIRAQFENNEELKSQAEALGVSVGKLKLATIASSFGSLSLEEAAQMSVRELNSIVHNARKEVKDFYKHELKEQYFDFKDELKVKYYQKVAKLIDDTLANLSDEELINLFGTIEVKPLYQNYLLAINDLLNSDAEESENQDSENDALKAELEATLAELLDQFTNARGKDKKDFIEQIRDIRKNLQELNRQFKGNKNHNRKEFDFDFETKGFKAVDKFELFFAYRDLRDKYVIEFRNIDVDFDKFERYFAEQLAEDINLIIAELEEELNNASEDFKNQGKAYRDYFKEERDLFKKNE